MDKWIEGPVAAFGSVAMMGCAIFISMIVLIIDGCNGDWQLIFQSLANIDQ